MSEPMTERWPIRYGELTLAPMAADRREAHVCKHVLNKHEAWWQITALTRGQVHEHIKAVRGGGGVVGAGARDREWAPLPPAERERVAGIYRAHYEPTFRAAIIDALAVDSLTDVTCVGEERELAIYDAERALRCVLRGGDWTRRLWVRTAFREWPDAGQRTMKSTAAQRKSVRSRRRASS